MARNRFPLNLSPPLFWLSPLLAAVILLLALPGGVQAAPASDVARSGLSDGGSWYMVQRGDNLFRIALHFGTTADAIARANHIPDPARIIAGQRLWIPAGYAPPPYGGGFWYTVRGGDNLYRIALHNGLSVQALAAANHITDPARITAGQRLWIPRGYGPVYPPPPGPSPDPGPHPDPPPVKGEWTGTFFNSKDLSGGPVRTETVAQIDYNWGAGSPDGLDADNFSAMWTGAFDFPPGDYRFLVTADDGVRLFLDETRIIDAWRDQSATGFFQDAVLTGGKHIVRVEYYEGEGDASITVSWRPLP